ncbi:hypothetical protein DPMN_011091 [Dreissena polymorpha]|uniref:Uncharacterized protein n=1 Tax=Dreissena polymorpha TaxID=45954 RepID=A0A9D4N2Y3_DREPO|nr:hypothetical protein DPMN_011091 [Dreissena polymorpha]
MYNSNHMVSNFPVEGRRLTELGIGSNVKKIDAAFIWSYNKRTYLVGTLPCSNVMFVVADLMSVL